MRDIGPFDRIRVEVSTDYEFHHAHILTMNFEEFKNWLDKEYKEILLWEFTVDLYCGDIETDPMELTAKEAYAIWLEGKMIDIYDGLVKKGDYGLSIIYICLVDREFD